MQENVGYILTVAMWLFILVVIFGSISFWVYQDNRAKTRLRELEQEERLRRIELGQPIDDVGPTRCKALMGIGIATSISGFVCAMIVSVILIGQKAIGEPTFAVGLVWVVTGLTCILVQMGVIRTLREVR